MFQWFLSNQSESLNLLQSWLVKAMVHQHRSITIEEVATLVTTSVMMILADKVQHHDRLESTGSIGEVGFGHVQG